MKTNGRQHGSITKPLLKPLMDRKKANSKPTIPAPAVGKKPLEPSDLYQDPGGAYNPDFTFPQE